MAQEDEGFKHLLGNTMRDRSEYTINSLLEHVANNPEKYAGDFLIAAAKLAKEGLSSADEEKAERISMAFRNMYNVYKEYVGEAALKKVHEILGGGQ